MDADLLDRVRKLLAKAEDEGCTPAEAEALTAKAAELMARYGIDRALLGALHPETDRPADRVFDLANPWGDVKGTCWRRSRSALRCQCVQTGRPGPRLHVFGYASDLERADILFTSLLVQMAGRWPAAVPGSAARPRRGGARGCSATPRRSWRGSGPPRSRRSRRAEADGAGAAATGTSTALVLADRSLIIRRQVAAALPSLSSSDP